MMMVRKSKGIGERHQKILQFIQKYQRENNTHLPYANRRDWRYIIYIGRQLLS